MSWLWVIFLLVGGVAGWVIKAVADHMIEEKAGTRLGRVPFAILALAVARLPGELRDDLASEWRAELESVLRKSEGMPTLTRLRRGIRYAVGLLISAPAVADGLRGDARRVLRVARLIGAAATISCTAWVSVLSYDLLNVTTPPRTYYFPVSPVSVGGTLRSHVVFLAPHVQQETVLAASYAVGAAALLCLAAWLATARRPLVYLGGAACVAAEILHFVGGGSSLHLWIAEAVFCIVFGIAAHQLSGRPARDNASRPLAE
jgi:hypothetical protein